MTETATAETTTNNAETTTTATATTAAAGTTLVTEEQKATSEQTQSTETKTEGATETKTEETKTEEKPKLEGAPEKYEFKAPEGKEFDAKLIEAFANSAKDANLTQEAAQKLLDTVAPALAARQEEQITAIQTEWRTSSTADKEFGGDKLSENLGVAKKALDTFGTPELRNMLEQTGLGNHPEVIRLLFRAGKAISEDTFVAGKAASQGETDPAKRLFPNQA